MSSNPQLGMEKIENKLILDIFVHHFETVIKTKNKMLGLKQMYFLKLTISKV